MMSTQTHGLAVLVRRVARQWLDQLLLGQDVVHTGIENAELLKVRDVRVVHRLLVRQVAQSLPREKRRSLIPIFFGLGTS